MFFSLLPCSKGSTTNFIKKDSNDKLQLIPLHPLRIFLFTPFRQFRSQDEWVRWWSGSSVRTRTHFANREELREGLLSHDWCWIRCKWVFVPPKQVCRSLAGWWLIMAFSLFPRSERSSLSQQPIIPSFFPLHFEPLMIFMGSGQLRLLLAPAIIEISEGENIRERENEMGQKMGKGTKAWKADHRFDARKYSLLFRKTRILPGVRAAGQRGNYVLKQQWTELFVNMVQLIERFFSRKQQWTRRWRSLEEDKSRI